MNGETRRLTLDELCTLVELPRRTVRYYVQEGLVDRPEGVRRGAYYTDRHLEQLLLIKKWQQAGLSLERIRELLHDEAGAGPIPLRPRQRGSVEVWSHLMVDAGVELHIEPKRAGLTPEQVRAFARGVMELFDRIQSNKE